MERSWGCGGVLEELLRLLGVVWGGLGALKSLKKSAFGGVWGVLGWSWGDLGAQDHLKTPKGRELGLQGPPWTPQVGG